MTLMESHFCPVCGFEGPPGARAPYADDGASFDTCPCCSFEYGVTDDINHETFESWRDKWIRSGAKWRSSLIGNPPPHDWDLAKQLRNIGIDIAKERDNAN